MTAITQEKQRTVAITGAGGGLGRATGLAFAAKGYRVFGTALRPEEIADLRDVATVYALEDVAQAWKDMAGGPAPAARTRRPHGKVVLRVD